MRAVLPAFRSQGEGLVINIGSILGRVTFPFFGLYGASKFSSHRYHSVAEDSAAVARDCTVRSSS
jgi:NADP-dependent 3-hydroxy acid dehydrogenase YdfG